MTADERAMMERPVAYGSEKAEAGMASMFGPVMDPARHASRYTV